MGDYRRWIAYVHEYCSDRERKSVGYARIESRNGICRITLNAKISAKEGRPQLFIFYRDGSRPVMIPLGYGRIRNNNCDFSYETRSDNIAGSGMRLEQLSGIVIINDSDKYYATVWDDKELELENAVFDSDGSNRIVVNAAGTITENEIEELPELSYHKETESVNIEDENMDLSGFEEQEQEIRYSEPDRNSYGELNRNTGYAESDRNASYGRMNNDTSYESQNRKDAYEGSEADKSIAYSGEVESGEGNSVATRIFSKYPGMYPFEDDEIVECVKLEPQDMGIFPMDKWVLANNSFLLHGYYAFRHLIFAKKRNKDGFEYILGVPGLYRDREKFMAGMFGFKDFKGVRDCRREYGEFGYWYMDIEF